MASGVDTHKCMHTTDVCTETILRNQVYTGLWPAHAWFKKNLNLKKEVGIAIKVRKQAARLAA